MEFSLPELTAILLGGFSPEKTCTTKAVTIQHSCTFVAALSCVENPIDFRADDSGVRITWVVTSKAKTIISQSREHPPSHVDVPPNGHLYILSRVYHVLQSSPDFKHRGETE